MLEKLIRILLISRVFSLPMTIMSWLVIFTYSALNNGRILYGFIALIGICFAHFGTNLLDDYFDYRHLIKQVSFDKDSYLKNSQKTKCRYLISGMLSENQLLIICGTYFFFAFLIGVFLFIKCGIGVLWFAIAASAGMLLYPLGSRICLAEILLAFIYGPVLFGGVYYVMCASYSSDVYLLSIPTMLMTVVLLYVHMVMDYKYDIGENKKTLANIFKKQINSLIVLKILLIVAYLSIVLLCIFDIANWPVFFVYLTIPLAVDLYKSMKEFVNDENSLPEHRWYHFPMENMKEFQAKGEDTFMIRIYQSRNLMIYFSIILAISLLVNIVW